MLDRESQKPSFWPDSVHDISRPGRPTDHVSEKMVVPVYSLTVHHHVVCFYGCVADGSIPEAFRLWEMLEGGFSLYGTESIRPVLRV